MRDQYFDLNHIKNISFEGTGISGIAYSTALVYLDSKKLLDKVQRVSGTSSGAAIALLYAIGFTPNELQDEILDLDFNRFKDPWFSILLNIPRIIKHYGLYSGDPFCDWLKEKIERKLGNPDITFAQLDELRAHQIARHGKSNIKQPYILTSDLSAQTPIVFSHETSCMYRHESLWLAVRASVSTPGIFMAVRTRENHILVDGGLVLNDPQILFDDQKYISNSETLTPQDNQDNPCRHLCEALGFEHYQHNPETLGLRMETLEEIQRKSFKPTDVRHTITSIFSYILGLLYLNQSTQDLSYLSSHNPKRTIEIDKMNISPADFTLTREESAKLFWSGFEAAKAFVEGKEAEQVIQRKDDGSMDQSKGERHY